MQKHCLMWHEVRNFMSICKVWKLLTFVAKSFILNVSECQDPTLIFLCWMTSCNKCISSFSRMNVFFDYCNLCRTIWKRSHTWLKIPLCHIFSYTPATARFFWIGCGIDFPSFTSSVISLSLEIYLFSEILLLIVKTCSMTLISLFSHFFASCDILR